MKPSDLRIANARYMEESVMSRIEVQIPTVTEEDSTGDSNMLKPKLS